jgi:hypothetical protein
MNMVRQDELRGFVDGVARDVAQVSRGASPRDAASVAELVGSWARLVDVLGDCVGDTARQLFVGVGIGHYFVGTGVCDQPGTIWVAKTGVRGWKKKITKGDE